VRRRWPSRQARDRSRLRQWLAGGIGACAADPQGCIATASIDFSLQENDFPGRRIASASVTARGIGRDQSRTNCHVQTRRRKCHPELRAFRRAELEGDVLQAIFWLCTWAETSRFCANVGRRGRSCWTSGPRLRPRRGEVTRPAPTSMIKVVI